MTKKCRSFDLLGFLALAWMFAACASKEAFLEEIQGTSPNRLPPLNYVQEDLYMPSSAASIDDPYYALRAPFTSPMSAISYLWNIQMLGVPSLYTQLSLPEKEIVVAVIDSGVDYDHEDLKGRLWVNPVESLAGKKYNGSDDDNNGYVDDFLGWDFVNNTNNPADDYGHGTHVAGVIAAIGQNAKGIIGVAPWVRIMALKACNDQGACSGSNIRAAVEYAIKNGAKIINLSLGVRNKDDEALAFESLLNKAYEHGILVTAAAGNDSLDVEKVTPANATQAIAVAAFASDTKMCSFSNYGWKVSVSAPGCAVKDNLEVAGILSLNSKKCGPQANLFCFKKNTLADAYVLNSGTSMAAPHVAGLAAVAWTAAPEATPLMIRQAIQRTALSLSKTSFDFQNGFGRVAAAGLIAEAQTSPGVKILTPRYGTQSEIFRIKIRVEARAKAVSYSLKYLVESSSAKLDFSKAFSTGFEGKVLSNSFIEDEINWSPANNGNYLMVLEAQVENQKYYDLVLLKK